MVAGLRDALKSKNAETSRYAAYAVGLHRGVTPLIPELIALLDDDRVAGTAAHSLSMMGPGGTVAVPQLTGLLSSDNDANGRIGELKDLQSEIKVWSYKTNSKQRGIDWRFKINDAQAKLKRLYTIIKA